ncbi:hypothetical protein [Burkholderia cenocepacia]|uniref:hypothetical protein n=2 Tax=Burkholderia cenocepacia TaxID=95486 RepID=UPI003C12C7CA
MALRGQPRACVPIPARSRRAHDRHGGHAACESTVCGAPRRSVPEPRNEGTPMKHDSAQWLQRPEPPLPDIEPDPEPPDPDDVPPDMPEPYREPEGDPPGHAPPERDPPAREPPVRARPAGAMPRMRTEGLQ